VSGDAPCSLVPARLDARWFDSIRDLVSLLPSLAGPTATWPAVAEIDSALGPLAAVSFVAGDKLRPRRRPDRPIDTGEVYEIRIESRREVPTRANNLHDLLNALAWAAFPAAKWALTGRLAEAQRARLAGQAWRMPGSRTRAHDRLALLDEGGILVAGEAGGPALVFGHALLEHALAGRLEVWGAALTLPVEAVERAELRGRLDRALAAALAADALLHRPEPWARLPLRALAGAGA
jgi:hypothetical protein